MARPTTINEYLASVPDTHRKTLKILHAHIKKLYPKATEGIGYGVPVYKLDGHPLCSFKASKEHNGLFPWSGTILSKPHIKSLIKPYSHGKGTIRFAPDSPLPLSLVKAVLKERELEIAKRWPKQKIAPKKKALKK